MKKRKESSSGVPPSGGSAPHKEIRQKRSDKRPQGAAGSHTNRANQNMLGVVKPKDQRKLKKQMHKIKQMERGEIFR